MSTAFARLSVSIVCKDNASTITRTLDSVLPLVKASGGEIVAFDSGSKDATLDLLENAGAKIIPTEWLGHVRTKQKALEACVGDWILCIDSDESLEPALADAIRGVLSSPIDKNSSGYMMNRRVFYRDQPLKHVWQPEWRLRLVRPRSARWGGFDPHDQLGLLGGALPGKLAGILRHDSFPTFAEHLRKQWSHANTMAQSLHASGIKGSKLRLMTSPAGAFFKQLLVKQGYRDGYAGWLASASTAAAALIKHSVLIELDHASKK